MRVTYLTLESTREGHAGYTHVHEIIAGLCRRGCAVRLYQPAYGGNPPGLPARLLLSLWLQCKLWTQWRGGILYVRGHYLAFPSALICRLFGIPIFHEINGPYAEIFVTYPALKPVRRILLWLMRAQYRWATGLIAVTEELRRAAAEESGGRPAMLISNGANTDLFRPGLPRPPGLPDRYVIFFGGLAAWHGARTMIDAANHAHWPQDIHLVIIGDGRDGERVRAAAADNPRLHALGRRLYQQVPAYVASSLAGLVPISNPDGRADTGLFPLKLFETLACGVPVIVTDFPGQADLVRDHACGLVIPADDPAALAAAVAALAADPPAAAAMGARGHAVIVAEHSWDRRAGATHDFLRALAGRGAA